MRGCFRGDGYGGLHAYRRVQVPVLKDGYLGAEKSAAVVAILQGQLQYTCPRR